MTGGKIALDGGDQRRRLHRGDEVIEETLFGGLKGRTGGGFRLPVQRAGTTGDIGGLQRCGQVGVDDLERPGIGVVDAGLLRRQAVVEHLIFDTFIRQGTGGVEAERLEVAGQNLHCRHAAGFNRLHEFTGRRYITVRLKQIENIINCVWNGYLIDYQRNNQ